MSPRTLESSSGETIAYHHHPGTTPGVIFCTGFKSDMSGTKAMALEAWCTDRGRQFTRFDYGGHGQSSGLFEDGTIGAWRDDALAVLDQVTSGPQLVVGSSMGGWIMLLLALARPGRMAGLLGVASAPDFTSEMLDERLSEAQQKQLAETGYCELDNDYDDGQPYRIGKRLLDEAEQHLLLQGKIELDLPVRLIHGRDDADVPWQRSLTLLGCLRGDDVTLELIKAGEHRLSRPQDLQRMLDTLDRMLA